MKRIISSSALALALATGTLVGGAVPAAAAEKAPKQESVSPAFAKAAGPFQKALNDAKTKPAVVAAKGNPAALGAALAAEKAQIEPTLAAATTPYDKYVAGSLVLNLGQLSEDPAILRRGLAAMIDSGKAPNAPQLQFFLGQTAMQLKDDAAAQAAFQAAIAAGYRDNDVEASLAQSYISGGKLAEGLATLRKAVETKQAAGAAAPQSWYRVGLGTAYKAKQLDQAQYFSLGLAQYYPAKENWASAIAILRDIGRYQPQEALDLMRLMLRTNSFMEGRDYIDFVQTADARRFPGEVIQVIDAGVASGKLKASDTFVNEAKTIATGRVAADKASLPQLERDARAPGAAVATVAAAADTFLSYGDSAKAAEFYTLALSKPGGDAARLNTRLGIAQVDKGDYAGAQASFAKVDGPRKPLAQLWSIYAAQKAAGK